jgi:hypothetical protein
MRGNGGQKCGIKVLEAGFVTRQGDGEEQPQQAA